MQAPDSSQVTTARSGGAARVVVVGAGVSGLVVARGLRAAGHEVTVLEAGPRVGGHVLTLDVAGRPVDVGAEALHMQVPAAAALVDEIGLRDDIVAARSNPSWLWTPRGRRRLPAGVGPAGPTQLRPVLRSGVMTWPALARAGLEPVLAARVARLPDDGDTDISVGDFVSSRFGRQVTRAFVDPLLGGLHSGDVDALSLRACAPSLVPAATSGRSLVRRRRAAGGPPAPAGRPAPIAFASWPQGMARLVSTLAEGLAIRTNTPVRALRRAGSGYTVLLDGGREVSADAVALALPAPAAARVLAEARPELPTASRVLAQTEQADTATVVLGYPRAAVADLPALAGNGMLVPSGSGTLLKAVTHLSTKWPHLDTSDDPDTYLVRLSAGRAGSSEAADLDDDALVTRLRADLARLEGIDAEPSHALVRRWRTGIPQLTVGHVGRLRAVRAELESGWPGVQLVGASYDGIGLTSCIASGQRAAAAIAARLAGGPHRTDSTRTEGRS